MRKEASAGMPEQRNLILAIVLSVTIILAFQYFYELPRIKELQRQQPAPSEQVTAPEETARAGPARHRDARPRRADARPDGSSRASPRAHGSRSATSACTARSR